MNLEDIAGGSVNRFGGIDVNYQPTGFSIENSGVIRQGYFDSGLRCGDDGAIRGDYGMRTGFEINSFGTIQREVGW